MNRAYALNRDKLKCRVCGGGSLTVRHGHTVTLPMEWEYEIPYGIVYAKTL